MIISGYWPRLNPLFFIIALLYGIINLLSWQILPLVPSAVYTMLLQHRMLWVVGLSATILHRRFELRHYLAIVFVIVGCIVVNLKQSVSLSDAMLFEMPSLLGLFYVVLQAFLSAATSVFTEKWMKSTHEPLAALTGDPLRAKLYWFLVDSYQMYLFGLPVYLLFALVGNVRSANSISPFVALLAATAFASHGMVKKQSHRRFLTIFANIADVRVITKSIDDGCRVRVSLGRSAIVGRRRSDTVDDGRYRLSIEPSDRWRNFSYNRSKNHSTTDIVSL